MLKTTGFNIICLNNKSFFAFITNRSSLKPPVVSKCDGDYEVDARRRQIHWTRPLVDAENDTGTLEFTISTDRSSKTDQFFPINVDFSSTQSYCGVEVKSLFNGQVFGKGKKGRCDLLLGASESLALPTTISTRVETMSVFGPSKRLYGEECCLG